MLAQPPSSALNPLCWLKSSLKDNELKDVYYRCDQVATVNVQMLPCEFGHSLWRNDAVVGVFCATWRWQKKCDINRCHASQRLKQLCLPSYMTDV